MATPEERVIHYARVWYETEKTATGATIGKKNQAKLAHDDAKKNLRNAVCLLQGDGNENKSSDAVSS